VSPPTAALETDAALTLAVLGATQYYGFAERGFVGYLRGFTRPTPLLLPLHLLAQLTRSFSLMVRLFGNIMSGELIIAIIVSLAALFVPVPLMLLELLIGLLQAYIFTVLATVFIAGAAGGAET
jgi:F-type H+-transporting ATPase subunit a